MQPPEHPHQEGEVPFSEEHPDAEQIVPEEEHGLEPTRSELGEELPRQEDEAIDEARRAIEATDTGTRSHLPEDRSDRIHAYQEKYLPPYLAGRDRPPVVAKLLSLWLRLQEKFGRLTVEGREHLPQEGPFIVVSNHSGGETGKVLGLLSSYSAHIASGEELNWKRSRARTWLLKQWGMFPVKETLGNYTPDEKAALLSRVPNRAKEGFARVAKNPLPDNRRFVRSAVALLSAGRAVVVFPEGVFDYQGRGLRKAYGGVELVARKYEELTGQEIPFIPVGIGTDRIAVGTPVHLSEQTSDERPVDWMMTQIASLLPSQERGVYRSSLPEGSNDDLGR
jgi:1-acyl-sn-glycerol-3-phosphate acyltransferase